MSGDAVGAKCRWSRVALLVVLATSACRDVAVLVAHPVAVGVDGYYYVLQLDALRDYGHLHFPTCTPLTLYALHGVSYLTDDTVTAVKIGSVLLHALLSLGVYAVLNSTTRSAWVGVLGSALAATSGLHFYMVAEFINHLGATALLIWCGWCAIQARLNRSVPWGAASAALLLAAVFSHRSAVFMALTTVLAATLLWLIVRPSAPRWHRPAALLALFIIWVSPAVASAQTLLPLSEWSGKELTAVPKWPLDRTTAAEGLMLLIAAPAALLLLRFSRTLQSRYIPAVVLGSVALVSLFVTLNPFLNPERGSLGIVGRLRGLEYVQAAIVVPGLIWLLMSLRGVAVVYASALILPLTILSVSSPLPFGLRDDYLAGRARMIRNLSARPALPGSPPLVIAPHGEQFVVSSVLGVPSQHVIPEESRERNIYWLAHEVEPRLMPASAVILGEESKGRYLAIIKDDELRHLLGDTPDAERQQLLKANPHMRKVSRSLEEPGGRND